ncbi:MAG: hypothetical protein P8Y70_07900 [Candidatus Lokiarchaeota archaeon]
MSIKEEIKQYWKSIKKYHYIFTSGFIAGVNLINWTLFFIGIISLHPAIMFTLFTVLLIISILLMKSKHKQTMAKIVYVGFLGYVLGFLMWGISMYVFISAPWAPFPMLKGPLSLYLILISLILGVLLGYAIGKKRNWKTRFTQNSEKN